MKQNKQQQFSVPSQSVVVMLSHLLPERHVMVSLSEVDL